jgi:two-component sensor histidine kinase
MGPVTSLPVPTPQAILANEYLARLEGFDRERIEHRGTEARLRAALAREDLLLRQRDEIAEQQELLRRESDHRLLNDLQMIVSLLSLQSRKSANPEVVSQLAIAANRVATVERVHRRLHGLDGAGAVAFQQYLEDFCRDISTMLFSDEAPERTIAVEAADVDLPTATAIPLGFIVNELITNAAKHGSGRIVVCLKRREGTGYALSVSNDGAPLPPDFDPAASKGLGMRIIRSFAGQIGGTLRIDGGNAEHGPTFEVQFPGTAAA